MNQFDQSRIWQKNLGIRLNDDIHSKEREFLRVEYEKFREKAALVAAEISRDLPDFTVHDITHIDSLWSLTDLIIPENYTLTPAEVFVLGGAFLLHDLGMGLAAYPEGIDTFKNGDLWRDTIAYYYKKELGRSPTTNEYINPRKEIETKALKNTLRSLHAKHAENLAMTKWIAKGEPGEYYYLIDNKELRDAYGKVIGLIAHSHWWSVDELYKRLNIKLGSPGMFSQEWTVDPVKIACILRIADASNLDDRRAPGFLRALRKIEVNSDLHWNFQQKLYQPRADTERLVYTSKSSFSIEECDSWWLCFDTLKLLDRELKEVDSLLAETGRQRLSVIAVAGIEDPRRLADLITVKDWHPVDTQIKVGDVAELVLKLGGTELYGQDYSVPIRELIQNSADAIKARRALEGENSNWGDIIIRKGLDLNGLYLEIEDNGIGMSTKVLTGPFLDFGQSFWGSPLMHEELPGLESTQFNSKGKYGIGFYSIFMISKKVNVFTRRYEAARENSICLEFNNAAKGRPILRKASIDEVIKNGGTRVRAYITPFVLDNILNNGSDQIAWRFEELIENICISLDVNVSYQDEKNDSSQLIAANDWISIPSLDLIQRVMGKTNFLAASDSFTELLQAYANHMEIITNEEGLIVGRCCISHLGLNISEDFDLRAIVAVDGLKADRMYNMLGVLAGKNLIAARNRAIPITTEKNLSAWATEQGRKIEAAQFISESEKGDLAGLVWNLGGSTGELPIAKYSRNNINYQQLIEILQKVEDHIIIIDGYAISNIENTLKSTMDLVSNVIEVKFGGFSFTNSGHYGDEVWPPEKKYSSGVYNFASGRLIDALSEAWKVKLNLMHNYFEEHHFEREQLLIGHINDNPVYESATIIRRDFFKGM